MNFLVCFWQQGLSFRGRCEFCLASRGCSRPVEGGRRGGAGARWRPPRTCHCKRRARARESNIRCIHHQKIDTTFLSLERLGHMWMYGFFCKFAHEPLHASKTECFHIIIFLEVKFTNKFDHGLVFPLWEFFIPKFQTKSSKRTKFYPDCNAKNNNQSYEPLDTGERIHFYLFF